jgi:hypothetical protein
MEWHRVLFGLRVVLCFCSESLLGVLLCLVRLLFGVCLRLGRGLVCVASR